MQAETHVIDIGKLIVFSNTAQMPVETVGPLMIRANQCAALTCALNLLSAPMTADIMKCVQLVVFISNDNKFIEAGLDGFITAVLVKFARLASV